MPASVVAVTAGQWGREFCHVAAHVSPRDAIYGALRHETRGALTALLPFERLVACLALAHLMREEVRESWVSLGIMK